MTAVQQIVDSGVRPGRLSFVGSTLRSVAGACESVQDIINIAATAEAFAVTALGGALANAASGQLALDAEQVQALTAARAESRPIISF